MSGLRFFGYLLEDFEADGVNGHGGLIPQLFREAGKFDPELQGNRVFKTNDAGACITLRLVIITTHLVASKSPKPAHDPKTPESKYPVHPVHPGNLSAFGGSL
jgi:hypothetical protein